MQEWQDRNDVSSMERPGVSRKLAAILSADVEGYSRLMDEDEIGTIQTLTTYRELMTVLVEQYRGRVVDSPGDNLLTEFSSALDAVQGAVEIQRVLTERNAELPIERQMKFRIGINVGDIIVDGDRLYGEGVNIAARLESLANGGGICLSGTVYDQVENKLPLGYEDLGVQAVKNIRKPVRVYRLQLETDSPVQPPNQRGDSMPNTSDKPAIAVLPFTNMSGDPEQEYFSDGITEDLITALSQLSGLLVISRNSSFFYKNKAVKSAEISRELKVRYFVEGSVRKAGNRVRITAQLIDAATGYHVWAERYDRDLQDIFAVQDEVTQKIVDALAVKFAAGERTPLGHAATSNLEAYDYYLRADTAYQTIRRETPIIARQLYERAIELDPHFAAAYAALSTTYLMEWDRQWSEDPATLERAETLARKAIELDERLAQAHSVLGGVYAFKRQHTLAIAENQAAIRLEPNSAAAHAWLAFALNGAGRPQETPALIDTAMRLNPHYPAQYLFILGQAQYLMGQTEHALATFRRVLTRNPNHLAAHSYLAILLSERGQREDSRAEVQAILRISPQYSLGVARERALYTNAATVERYIEGLRKAGLE